MIILRCLYMIIWYNQGSYTEFQILIFLYICYHSCTSVTLCHMYTATTTQSRPQSPRYPCPVEQEKDKGNMSSGDKIAMT